MAKFAKRTFALIGVLFLAATCIGYFRYYDVINVRPVSFADTQDVVLPHLQLFLPEADEPRPAVLLFHGCGGVKPSLLTRAQELAGQGYVAIIVDSFTGRNIDWEQVCAGQVMFGDQRAADVLVALEYARNHSAIDAQKLFVTGYSHGGWAVLESLTYNEELPRGLLDSPSKPLTGLRGVIAWYPYCGIGTHFRDGWHKDIPVLMLLAEEDEITDAIPCASIAQEQAASGLPVEWHLFENVSHGFDTKEEWVQLYDVDVHDRARSIQLDFLQQHSGLRWGRPSALR